VERIDRTPRYAKSQEMLAAYQLKRVVDFVESRLSSPLALADLARVAGGSVFHFSRAFRNTAGDTPYRFLLRRRVERGKLMLAGTDTPIATVARKCGFSSPANFAKTFSRFVGTTPKRYRQGEVKEAPTACRHEPEIIKVNSELGSR
jgi:AraC family transcriptional regulator